MRTAAAGLTIVAMAFLAAAPAARGEGAFALGITDSVKDDGVAYGWVVNAKTRAEARDKALEHCKSYKDAPRASAKCRVMTSFRDQCAAVAMDPKAGTPGFGWAIADSRKDAEAQALADCRATAGRGRTDFCKSHDRRCDGESD